MNFVASRVREAGVVNFVYRLGETVKRLKNGAEVSQHELDRLLSQMEPMGTAIQEMQSAYPELPGIFERMRLRLQILLGERAQQVSSPSLTAGN